MRDNEHTIMLTMFVKKLNCEADEVIPVSGYKAPAFRGSALKLLSVRNLQHPNLVAAYSIYMVFSEYLRNLWTKVFIKVIFQREPLWRKGYFL